MSMGPRSGVCAAAQIDRMTSPATTRLCVGKPAKRRREREREREKGRRERERERERDGGRAYTPNAGN